MIAIRERSAMRALAESGNCRSIRFAPPGHFYSPIPDIRTIKANADMIFDPSQKEITAVDLNADFQQQLVKKFVDCYSEMPFPDQPTKEFRYCLDNEYYSYGDGIILYSMLRFFRPKNLIEVGSGFSSAEILDVNDRFLGRKLKITFIEPYPDRLFSLISDVDRENVHLEIKPVQDVPLSVFDILQENDLLFIDSSHVAKTNSDVLFIVYHVLPRLKKGVIIHFHDIFWPFEYPQAWLEEGRAWNEAYFLCAFLQYNPAFEIIYFNSYMATHCRPLLMESIPKALHAASDPMTPGNSSLWLRKVR